MKFFIAVLALAAVAHADVSHILNASGPEAAAQILSQEADVFPDQYQFKYATSNGIQAQESGALKNAGREDAAIEAQGSNQFTAPDGQVFRIDYIANEFGYQPQGAHLPTTPAPLPIPDYIVRAIEYIRTHPPKPEEPQQAYNRRL